MPTAKAVPDVIKPESLTESYTFVCKTSVSFATAPIPVKINLKPVLGLHTSKLRKETAMQAEEGKRVTIAFICRLEDGTFYDVADRDMLEFVIGQGNTLPTLEMGVTGMKPGEHRVIRVPAAELEEFPFEPDEAPSESGFPAGVGGPGYDFEPGEPGDVILTGPPRVRPARMSPPAGADLIFDVDMVQVEDAELEWES